VANTGGFSGHVATPAKAASELVGVKWSSSAVLLANKRVLELMKA